MPNEDFWNAVQRLVVAADAGEDIATIADDLLDADASLGAQLQEAMACLDLSALAKAVQLSDGIGASEDAMIAAGCAVIASGSAVYGEAVCNPESLLRPWDLSRGDMLLALNPGLTLSDVGQSPARRGPYKIDIAIGDSRFGWPGRITDAVAYTQSRRQEKSPRWRAIFDRHDVQHLTIGLEAGPDRPCKVGRHSKPRPGYLLVQVSWNAPRSPLGLRNFVRSILDAVATSLER